MNIKNEKKYQAKCPVCGVVVISSFKDSPVLTVICKCGYCVLEDEVEWEEV